MDVAEVVVELGGKEILRIPLKGPTMTIGRDPQCDLHLDNRALSRRHAQIEKRGAAIWVRDLESQNGTFVNGARIADPQALNGGDRIEVGRYEVRIDGVEEARQDTPVLTLTGPEGRHRFAMVGDEIILGRAPSCDIAIGHKSISRRHMRIATEGDHFIAEDLGSQNGSRINNKRINGPTAFRIGDKIQMSEFTIEVGYLEAPETNAGGAPAAGNGAGNQKVSKTMMIDRSELAKAAYVGGDFEKMGSNAGNISMGAQQQAQGGFGGKNQTGEFEALSGNSEQEATRGIPPASEDGPPPPPPPAAPPPPQPVKPGKKPPPPAQTAGPILTVNHPDAAERAVVLDGDVTILGEDGGDGDGTDGRVYANQGYIIFVKAARSVHATVAGDRRLLTVNGKALLNAVLNEGDTLELGLLTVVFHHQG
jgi:pSer/pThr/pTyr-binding forkhead associated (FHA) protein